MNDTTQHPETLSRSGFAAYINVKPGYVTQMITAGRIVLTDDGKRVLVAESLERIEATRDPSKMGVAEYHAKERGAEVRKIDLSQTRNDPDTIDREISAMEKAGNLYQASKALREKYSAMTTKLEYEVLIKQYLKADDVASALSNAATIVRARLESLPDTLAAQLAAEKDEQRCRAILAENIETTLTELNRRFLKITEQPNPT